MIRNRILLKSFAVFFLFEILSNTIAPAASWALTAGPTAPEATSFEPVDTTDMVNSVTGDFVYNIPLLEVPGPAGSYPLSLSYHGGIQTNMDASWVGLGWTLNPGAINRLVNGVPDDFDGLPTSNRLYWDGGETQVNTYGLSVGIANFGSVSAGLSFANDTYKGRGVGGNIGVNVGLGGSSPVSIDVSVGISPYGAYSVGFGVGLSKSVGEGASLGMNAGLTVNDGGSIDAGLSGGITMGAQKKGGKAFLGSTVLGASISSNKSSSLTVGGFSSSIHNAWAGRIKTYENNLQVDIPVWYGLNIHIGRDYMRYWMDETESLKSSGTLYFPNEITDEDLSTKLFDSYHIQGVQSITTGKPPQGFMSGSYADYDNYSVNAQGLGGNIRPYHYDLSLYSQDVINKNTNTKQILDYPIPQHSLGVRYRFVNDFSNQVTINPTSIALNKTAQDYSTTTTDQGYIDWQKRLEDAYETQNIPLLFPYSTPQVGMGEPGNKIPTVPGSKHIEYFTNYDIVDEANLQKYDKGFIDCNASGFGRPLIYGPRGPIAVGADQDLSSSIGAYSITNESGMTYHFSLPAYSKNEHVYSGKKDVADKISFNDSEQDVPYAYTWYLTAVTGPDYVDRGLDGNPDHKLNEYDWGYWVEFQYGKWTDGYRWRNPSEGYNADIDANFQSFSIGQKEIYYLNAIRTQTHTALFTKELRADGKGTTSQFGSSVGFDAFNNFLGVDPGGFNVVSKNANFYSRSARGPRITPPDINYYEVPVSTLRLKSIELFKNEDLNPVLSSYNNLDNKYIHNFTYQNSNDTRSITLNVHLGQNVLDINDVSSGSFPHEKAIRKIDFDFDYSLCPGTANSFDEAGQLYACTAPCLDVVPDNTLTQTKLGKLTLKMITFKGKGNVESVPPLIPPLKFSYDYTNTNVVNGTIASIDNLLKIAVVNLAQTSSQFQTGDIVKFNQGTNQFYGYIQSTNSGLTIKVISNIVPVSGLVTAFEKTKNPPYNKDFYDMWGLYKVDYHKTIQSNIDRYPTHTSALNSDCWSLREIQSSTGATIKIQYGPDTYGKSIFSGRLAIPLYLVSDSNGNSPLDPSNDDNNGPTHISLSASVEDGFSIDLTKLYKVGDMVDAAVAGTVCTANADQSFTCTDVILGTATVEGVFSKELRIGIDIPEGHLGTFYGGCMKLVERDYIEGGGTRVNSIAIDDPMKSEVRSTQYTYDFDGESSGVTSYEPLRFQSFFPLASLSSSLQTSLTSYQYDPLIKVLALGRELPAPGVYYGKIRIDEQIQKADGTIVFFPNYNEYEFESLRKEMINIYNPPVNVGSPSTGTFRDQTYHSIGGNATSIQDFTQHMGNLKSIILYTQDGTKISETRNHYLKDEDPAINYLNYPPLLNRFKNQGVIHEVFNYANYNDDYKQLQGLISKKESYPSVQTGQTTINYKTGITTSTQNLAFDFYSGQVSQTLSTDGYGNTYLSEIIPAYQQYNAMGIGGKNMLTQEAASYTYKLDPVDNSKIGLVGASIQTWSDQIHVIQPGQSLSPFYKQPGIWRKRSSFSFIGDNTVGLTDDGLYSLRANPVPVFTSWNGTTQPDAVWQKNGEITLYDINSHELEATDINNNFAATKMTFDQSRVLVTGANCSYGELAYSGAEEQPQTVPSGSKFFGGNVYCSGTWTAEQFHTGSHAVKADAGLAAFTFNAMPSGDTYVVSFWSSQPTAVVKYSFDGFTNLLAEVKEIGKAGNWHLLEARIPPTSNATWLSIWNEASTSLTYFDDFRVHPLDAAVISYVYNSWGELSHILDNNNLYTEYRYDAMGRLKETYKETLSKGVVKTSEQNYHYATGN